MTDSDLLQRLRQELQGTTAQSPKVWHLLREAAEEIERHPRAANIAGYPPKLEHFAVWLMLNNLTIWDIARLPAERAAAVVERSGLTLNEYVAIGVFIHDRVGTKIAINEFADIVRDCRRSN